MQLRISSRGLTQALYKLALHLCQQSGWVVHSDGAIYIRDPEHKAVGEQLNGGHFHPLADADWALIKPYLVENEKLFGIKLDDVNLGMIDSVGGKKRKKGAA